MQPVKIQIEFGKKMVKKRFLFYPEIKDFMLFILTIPSPPTTKKKQKKKKKKKFYKRVSAPTRLNHLL